MDKVQKFNLQRIRDIQILRCFSSSIGAITLQHCRHWSPLCPPLTGPTMGMGTDRVRTRGSPKDHTLHRLPSNRRLELSGFCGPRRGLSHPSDVLPTHRPHLPLPLDLDSPSPWSSRQPGSKVNTAATHQTWFKSPVSMLNGKST